MVNEIERLNDRDREVLANLFGKRYVHYRILYDEVSILGEEVLDEIAQMEISTDDAENTEISDHRLHKLEELMPMLEMVKACFHSDDAIGSMERILAENREYQLELHLEYGDDK